MTKDRRFVRLGQDQIANCDTGEIHTVLNDKQLTVQSVDQANQKQCAFTTRKEQAKAVGLAYRANDDDKIAKYILGCGHRLWFNRCPSGHYQKLSKAYFCKKRLCPMCQWRRSLKTFGQVSRIADEYFKTRKSDKAILLTFTVPNCSAEKLKDTLSDMNKAFNNLMRRDEILGLSNAWFRTTEVTYNRRRRDYHPHFHVLLTFSKRDYEFHFDKRQRKNGQVIKSQLHISQDHVRRRWTDLNNFVLKDDNQTLVCDIRRIKVCDVKAISEIAKYATKPSNYVKWDDEKGCYVAFSSVVKALHNGLHRKRLVAYGKEFKEIRKKLDMEDVEANGADLVNVDDSEYRETCPCCDKPLKEHEFLFKNGFYIED